MFKALSRLAMLSSFLFIPFFSIANQDSEYAVERFCQAISVAFDNLSCIDENMDFSHTENFFDRYEKAAMQCIDAGGLNRIDDSDKESAGWGSNSEVPFIESFWSAKLICVLKEIKIEHINCLRDLYYDARRGFCGGR